MEDEAVWDLRVRTSNGRTVLALVGELDLDTAPRLVAQVDRCAGGTPTSVVIDLDEVTFVDSSGLGALVACWRRLRQAGVPLTIANPNEDVSLTLEITGLDQILPLERRLPDAA